MAEPQILDAGGKILPLPVHASTSAAAARAPAAAPSLPAAPRSAYIFLR